MAPRREFCLNLSPFLPLAGPSKAGSMAAVCGCELSKWPTFSFFHCRAPDIINRAMRLLRCATPVRMFKLKFLSAAPAAQLSSGA